MISDANEPSVEGLIEINDEVDSKSWFIKYWFSLKMVQYIGLAGVVLLCNDYLYKLFIPNMSGLYLHIPFCKKACHYCDFHFSTQLKKKDAMVQALHQELVLREYECRDDVIETIYFGGGTPSLLEVATLEALIATVYKHYTVGEQPEITLEANPDDLSLDMLQQLAQSPINRLSIGVQSFFDHDLQWMNRAHNAQEAEQCLTNARKYFNNISIDLIYGVPGTDNFQWQKNIDKAVALGVPHISGYALTVEPRTALYTFIEKGIVPNVDDIQARDQFYMLVQRLEQEGYIHYEISNFGKPGFFSRNNSLYWQGKKYLGIGPSAHSFDGIQRSWNIKNNTKYIKALAQGQRPCTKEQLTLADQYNEYIMTGLRTIWGVSLDKIRENFGETYWMYVNRQAKKHINEELLYIDHNVLKATRKGKFLVDGIASDLFILSV